MTEQSTYKVRIWTHERGTRKLKARVTLPATSVEDAIRQVQETQPKRKTPRFYTCKEVTP